MDIFYLINLDRPIWFGLGIVAALFGLLHAGMIARRKNSADVVFQSRLDKELRDGFKIIYKLHDSDEENIRKFAKPEHRDTEQAKAIGYVLNHYEYISVGIQRRIYDEKLFKSSSYTTVIKLYNRTKPFIDEVRDQQESKTIYQEFEWLACKWKKKKLKAKKIKAVIN